MASNIIVFGAHGKVGQRLIALLAKHKANATAVVRSDAQAEQISKIANGAASIKTTQLDIGDTSVKSLSDKLTGHDAIVLTVGSAGKDLLKVDLDGVVKTFEAAVETNIRRVILVSALFAENHEVFEKLSLRNYYIAKHYADRILTTEFASKLDYTILKPSHLTDGEGTGKIDFVTPGDDIKATERQDVAQVIYSILDNKNTFGKSYNFTNGEKAIDDESTWA